MAAPEGRELQRRESSHMAYDEDWNPDYASMSLEVLQEELQRVRCSAPKLGIADTGRLLMKAGDQVKNLLSPRSSSDTPQQTVSSEKATEAATQIEHLIIPLLRKAGRMKDALEIAKASEASVRAAYGNAHPYTLQSRFLLGTMLHRTNAEEEAQTMHRQVLAARQELLGAAHASTIESMYELALTLQAMGFATTGAERAAKLHEAEMLFRQVRKMLHRDRKPTVEALAAATSLASLLRKSAPQQVAEAEELLRTSLDLLVQSQGALHPETLVAKNQLGQLLHETGRQDEALSLLQDTLTGRLEVLGNSHPQVFNARSALSRLYKDMGRHVDAAMVLRPQDVVDVKKVVGSTHRVARQVSDTLDDISNAYEEIEKAMDAPWKGKALRELPPLPSFKPRSKQSSRKSAVAEQLDEVAEQTSSHQGASSVKGRGERKDVLAQAARRMRDPAYTCREFYADMVYAFPELGLYLTEPLAWKTLMQLPELLLGGHMMEDGRKSFSNVRKVSQQTTSGMTALEEYNRTIGCMFAVFWLYRLQLDGVPGSEALDGQRGFCFGVNCENWRPYADADELQAKGRDSEAQASKRAAFHKALDWTQLHQLMIDAGLLATAADGSAEVVFDRTVSMLTLTAIHDVMKIPALLPKVLPEHAPYNGYEANVKIEDHDVALGYLLEHDSSALPSFVSLSAAQKRPIKFCQAKLGFNHGWLVQAEAPPGALFNSFKAVLDAGALENADVAFYFVHWLTDLAGAEPRPLYGSEKFACKFPASVLASFIRSFPIVQQLASCTQTELMEEFLRKWWPTEFGAPLTGPTAVAEMRLVVQAQSPAGQQAVRAAFGQLSSDDVSVLGFEMALSGVRGQAYEASPASGGPAFLVYYSPAFVRQFAQDMRAALRALAEVYRAARKAYPLSEGDQASTSVTVRIDQLKACAAFEDIPAVHDDGCCWVLVAKSSKEALVERHPIAQLPALAASDKVVVLNFGRNNLLLQPDTQPVVK